MSKSDGVLIYNIFADRGTESEVLSTYGRVVRLGLNARDTNRSEPVVGDAKELPLQKSADLVVLHPPCTKWSQMTSIDGDTDNHENLIPLAREIGREYGEHYIIENKPSAPLHDPVRLKGDIFGLPIEYERAFETSFHVEQPTIHMTFGNECSPYFYSDRTRSWWASVKGYSGPYGKQTLAKNAVPSPYIQYLMRAWLRATNEVDGSVVMGHNKNNTEVET